jgi:hypothetical protein
VYAGKNVLCKCRTTVLEDLFDLLQKNRVNKQIFHEIVVPVYFEVLLSTIFGI